MSFYPACFRVAIPYLLASLAYHKDYLKTKLHARHPLFHQPIWTTGMLNRLHSRVTLNGTNMKATGVPPHIMIQSQICEVKENVTALRDVLVDVIMKLPKDVTTELLTHFQINGATPISSQQFNDFVSQLESTLNSRDANIIQQLRSFRRELESTQNEPEQNNNQVQSRSWTWGGKIRKVPEDFIFPTGNLKLISDLWWEGYPERGICPLRFLTNHDLEKKNKQVYLSKARRVIETIVSYIPNETSQTLSTKTTTERNKLFQDGLILFYKSLSPNESEDDLKSKVRLDINSYVTYYDKILKSTARPST